MAEHKPSEVQAENEERLREELRNLPHVKAPWYFESALQQRLQQGTSARGFAARPVLATAMTVLLLALVGSVGYYAYFSPYSSTTESATDSVKSPVKSSPSQVRPPQATEPERQHVLLPAEGGSVNSGPSEPVNGIATGNHSAPLQTEERPRPLPTSVLGNDSGARYEIAPQPGLPPVQPNAAARVADTLSVRRDTASRHRDSVRTSPPDTLRRIR